MFLYTYTIHFKSDRTSATLETIDLPFVFDTLAEHRDFLAGAPHETEHAVITIDLIRRVF